MDNKYKQLMDNVEVSDEMRQRILQNIGEMDLKPRASRISPVNARRKATVSRIIGIVAAAGIVLAVGGVVLLRYASFGATKSAEAKKNDTGHPTVADAGQELDSIAGQVENFAPAADNRDEEEGAAGAVDAPAEGVLDAAETKRSLNDSSSASYGFKNQSLLSADKSSTKIDKISYVDEEGTEYILTDPSSILKILRSYRTESEGTTGDKADLTLYIGSESKEYSFYGSDVTSIIDLIKEKGVVSKEQ